MQCEALTSTQLRESTPPEFSKTFRFDHKGEAAAVKMFPEEIYNEILLRLPVKSAIVCKCVCKAWFTFISNPSFAKSHLHLTIQKHQSPSLIVLGQLMLYSISHDSVPSLFSTDLEFLEYAVEMDYPLKSPDNSVVIMGCCDGLVCLQFWCDDDDMNFFCLWNPTTKEYKKLPKSPNGLHNYPSDMIGLGYDCKNDDYKFAILGSYDVLEVYSLGLNSWTCIENVPYYFIYYQRVGVLVNRDLHWLALAKGNSKVVVCLNFGDDVFKEIQLPNELLVNANDRHIISLGALEGRLCLLVQATNVHSEVWVMQDYGVQA